MKNVMFITPNAIVNASGVQTAIAWLMGRGDPACGAAVKAAWHRGEQIDIETSSRHLRGLNALF